MAKRHRWIPCSAASIIPIVVLGALSDCGFTQVVYGVVQLSNSLPRLLEHFVDVLYYRFSVLGEIYPDRSCYGCNAYSRSEYECHCLSVAHSSYLLRSAGLDVDLVPLVSARTAIHGIEDPLNERKQFHRIERLCQIAVNTGLPALEHVGILSLSG